MIPSHIISILAKCADAAVQSSLRAGAPGQTTPILDEPGFVAAVALGAIPQFAPQWRTVLRPLGYTVSIVSVFCHQSPMVQFKGLGTGRCELADLLVVLDDLTSPVPRRTAVLIQAKMLGKSAQVFGSAAHPQFFLYTTWPDFHFRSAAYRPGLRNFRASSCPCNFIDGGRYGLIDAAGTSPNWYQSVPAASMSATQAVPLGTYIADMLGPQGCGFGRCCLPPAHDDWSDTIDEILRVTATKSFVHKSFVSSSPGRVKKPRYTSAICLTAPGSDFAADEFAAYCFGDSLPPEGPPRADRDGPEGDGVSAIRIVVGPSKDGGEGRGD